jgi:6-phosphofructokinase 2
MAAIATLTLNPALDVNTATPEVRPTHKLRCASPAFEPGGGGINVARVVHALGGEVVAVFPSGGAPGQAIERLLEQACVPSLPVAVEGVTRESFTVDETGSGKQFRFVLPGAPLSADELRALLASVAGLAPAYVVASGSLPPAGDPAILREVAALCTRIGARLVVDTSGPALAACEGIGAYLIKPSIREVEELVARSLPSEADEEDAARELHRRRFAELVVVSLGERGALMAGPGELVRLRAVPVPPGGTVGAGDAMTGALVLALADGKSPEQALRYGVAAGAAALMTPPAELVRREDVERLLAQATAATRVSSELASAPQKRP